MKTENKGISRLSSICMILIVMMHCVVGVSSATNGMLIFNNFIFNTFTRVSVPVFFGISGYFLAKNYSYELKLKSRVKTLLIPFILWSAISVLIFVICPHIPFLSSFFNKIIPLNFSSLMNVSLIHPINGSLWFIRDLFILVLLSPLYVAVIRTRYLKYLFLIIVATAWIFDGKYRFLLEPSLFFSIGIYLREYNKLQTKELMSRGWWAMLILLYLAVCVICSYYMFRDTTSGSSVALRKICVIIGGVCAYISIPMLDRINKVGLLDEFKKYSFFVYASHLIFAQFIKKLFLIIHTPHSLLSLILTYAAVVVSTIFICCILQRLLKMLCPSVLNYLTGGRFE